MILVTIASSIGSATRGLMVQIILLSFAAFILGIYQKNIVIRPYHKILIMFFAACLFIVFFTYSNYLIKKREAIDSGINPITVERSNANYFLYKIIPENFHPLINSTSFYISHSYYQLNKALSLPYKGFGFGLSNSFFVVRNIEKATGWSGLENISYGIRLDKEMGGNYGHFWSTFYTWIASDFTFPGTILVVFLIGFLLSIALRDTIFCLNPLAVTSFCTLFHFIFHFVFNNPLQDGAGITTYFVIPVVWLWLRKHNTDVEFKSLIRKILNKPVNLFHSLK